MANSVVPSRWIGPFYGGPLAVWMVTIFHFSTRAGTPQHSQGIIEWLLSRLDPLWLSRMDPYLVGRLDYVVRKAGHLTRRRSLQTVSEQNLV